MIQLSPKAIRFIIEAITHYQTVQEERLQDEGVPEEEVTDLTNDHHFLEAIKTDLHKYHEELVSKGSAPIPRQ
jgi:hypothetical protein